MRGLLESLTPQAREIYWKWVGGMFALCTVLLLAAAGVFVGHESPRKLAQQPVTTVATDGQIYDLDRIMYLRNYLAQLQRATSEGVPVSGYFLWSLMDNFEWIFGYEKRFGLYHVDFETQRRTPKLSVAFYRDVVARNAIGV